LQKKILQTAIKIMTDKISMLMDFYELTMAQSFFKQNKHLEIGIFDFFYRANPFGNGYAIFAGLEQFISYIQNLKFSEEDISYLNKLKKFDKDFLEYLKNFKFDGDIYSVKEGSVIFPNEPLIKITAPILQAHIIEGALLNIINHQSLIATKASRIVQSAGDNNVMEFGLRRAHSPSAALYGSRASIIGGIKFTSNVMAGQIFDIPIAGTHSHSWVMSFDTELEAFEAYAINDPCILLVDTYNTLKSGVPNAIKIFDKLKKQGSTNNYGIRLDSGDLAYISKKAREMLDKAGHENAIIAASNDLDENLISDLKQQGAKISLWGIGTNLITSSPKPSFGGVYKLSGIYKQNKLIPKIKISETPEKINNPSNKKLIRIYDKQTNKMIADLITLENENINTNEDLTLFHPIQTWKKMKIKKSNYYVKDMLIKIFEKGNLTYKNPSVMEIHEYANKEKETLWEEYKRITNPNIMPVDLSQKLYDLKQKMINDIYDTF